MKTKSDKGVITQMAKLLRKIGIFEILVGLLFLLSLLVIMLMTRAKKEWVTAEVKISSSNWWQSYYAAPPFWLGESIKLHDKEFDAGGRMIAEVKDIKEYELSGEGIDNGVIEATTRKDFYLTLDLKVAKSLRTQKITFKNQPLEIGAPIELHLSNTYVIGIVSDLGTVNTSGEEKELIIDSVWLSTFPWNAEAVPVGGEMKDGLGRTLAKILEKQVELADMVVTTDDGRVLVRNDPTKRDVLLKLRIMTHKKGDIYYFRGDQKIKIGENLFLHFPTVDVDWLSIKKIYDTDGREL